MTREEAIKKLREILTEAVEFENSVCYVTEEDREPLEMAIQALSQEPCDDAISRKLKIGDEIYIRANVNEIRNDYIICENKGGYFGTVREEIYPSVQSKSGEWIVDLQTATEDYYICSECGRRIHLLYPDTIDNYPYCHCGARMESEDKE